MELKGIRSRERNKGSDFQSVAKKHPSGSPKGSGEDVPYNPGESCSERICERQRCAEL